MPDQFTTSTNFGPNKDVEHPSEVETTAEQGKEITQTGETIKTNEEAPETTEDTEETSTEEPQDAPSAPEPADGDTQEG